MHTDCKTYFELEKVIQNNDEPEYSFLTFQKMVTWNRWLHGIMPHLPPPEERERVKKEMIEKLTKDRKRM